MVTPTQGKTRKTSFTGTTTVSETVDVSRHGRYFVLADVGDRRHEAVRTMFLARERSFLLHDWILSEAFSLLTKRIHKSAALRIIGALRASLRIEITPVNADLLQAGWEHCRRFADKEWDWIDCVTFELMQRRGIHEALSLDRHVAQAGFSLLVG